MYEYEGKVGEHPMVGITIIGYDLANQRFQSAWVDTFHMGTGILFSQSPKGGPGDVTPAVTGAWSQDGGPDWGWRTEYDLQAPDRLVITAYIITPEGQEGKATETVYTRQG
jgi:hypothetical protein